MIGQKLSLLQYLPGSPDRPDPCIHAGSFDSPPVLQMEGSAVHQRNSLFTLVVDCRVKVILMVAGRLLVEYPKDVYHSMAFLMAENRMAGYHSSSFRTVVCLAACQTG